METKDFTLGFFPNARVFYTGHNMTACVKSNMLSGEILGCGKDERAAWDSANITLMRINRISDTRNLTPKEMVGLVFPLGVLSKDTEKGYCIKAYYENPDAVLLYAKNEDDAYIKLSERINLIKQIM